MGTHRGASNEYTQYMFLWIISKNIYLDSLLSGDMFSGENNFEPSHEKMCLSGHMLMSVIQIGLCMSVSTEP